MTDKLHCPFCGAELEQSFDGKIDYFYCPNDGCVPMHNAIHIKVWQALIDGKKAQDALKVARNLYQELALAYCKMADYYRTTYVCLKTPEQETQEYMQEYDKEITSITTGDK